MSTHFHPFIFSKCLFCTLYSGSRAYTGKADCEAGIHPGWADGFAPYTHKHTFIHSYLKGHRVIDVGQGELFQEALVSAPEESDIRYAEQNHSESFQAQAKRPADFIPSTRCKEIKRCNHLRLICYLIQSCFHFKSGVSERGHVSL